MKTKTKKSVRREKIETVKDVLLTEREARAAIMGIYLAIANTEGNPPKRTMALFDSFVTKVCRAFDMSFCIEECSDCGGVISPILRKNT